MNENELRKRAKDLGIRNWHNRKIDELNALVIEKDKENILDNQVVISFDSLFSSVSDSTKEEIVEYLTNIEILSENINFCDWLESLVISNKIVSGTNIDIIYNFWRGVEKYCNEDYFTDILIAFVFVSSNSGWRLSDGVLYWDELPNLLPSWHAKRWLELSSKIDREKSRAIFGILFGS